MIRNFFLGPVIIWLPVIFNLLIVIIFIIRFVFKDYWLIKFLKLNLLTPKKIFFIIFCFNFLFNLLLTGLQYYVWQSSDFSKFFLPPFQPLSYFIGYTYHHFWLASVLSLVVVVILFGVLELIRKYRQGEIALEEVFLILSSCLLVSWPRVVILIPLLFFTALIIGLINFLFLKNKPINIFWPLIISLIITLFIGSYLLYVFDLNVLIV